MGWQIHERRGVAPTLNGDPATERSTPLTQAWGKGAQRAWSLVVSHPDRCPLVPARSASALGAGFPDRTRGAGGGEGELKAHADRRASEPTASCIRGVRPSHWTARPCRASLQPIAVVGRSSACRALGARADALRLLQNPPCTRASALTMQEPLLRAEGLDYDTFPEAPASQRERSRAG